MSVLEAIRKCKNESEAWKEAYRRQADEREHFKKLKIEEAMQQIASELSDVRHEIFPGRGYDVIIGEHIVRVRVEPVLTAAMTYDVMVEVSSGLNLYKSKPEEFLETFAQLVVDHNLI